MEINKVCIGCRVVVDDDVYKYMVNICVSACKVNLQVYFAKKRMYKGDFVNERLSSYRLLVIHLQYIPLKTFVVLSPAKV